MLTVEEYISQMKKRDKLDEFNFRNHAGNMASVISYVMEYFNNYLNPEAYHYEQIKLDQTIEKIRQEIEKKMPRSVDFIVEYYKENVTRIDRSLKKYLENFEYGHLFYCREDYEKLVDAYCKSYKMKKTDIEKYREAMICLTEGIKYNEMDPLTASDFMNLDNGLIGWIKEIYHNYRVNILDYSHSVAHEYYEKYLEYAHDRFNNSSYHINHYNHRYQEDPFDISDIYEANKHRPFINVRKGELEMLIMRDWIFTWAHDSEYWSEYVNLCVSTARVSIVKNRDILTTIKLPGISYSPDMDGGLFYHETSNGILKTSPSKPYILRINYSNNNDSQWSDHSLLTILLTNLNSTFSKYGPPEVLEIVSPLKSDYEDEVTFLEHYLLFEKGLKKHKNMKISLVNAAPFGKNKQNYLMQSADDIVKIRNIAKQMKLKLNFTIDIPGLFGRKQSDSDSEGIFFRLAEIKNSILGIHMNKSFNGSRIRRILTEDDSRFISEYHYPHVPDLLGCLTSLFGDNKNRYLFPKNVGSQEDWEDLADELLRAGFCFGHWEVE